MACQSQPNAGSSCSTGSMPPPMPMLADGVPHNHRGIVEALAGRPLVDTFITEVSQDTWIFFPWDMALQYVEPFRGKD